MLEVWTTSGAKKRRPFIVPLPRSRILCRWASSGGAGRPQVRMSSVTGATRSTSTSTAPGSPCSSGTGEAGDRKGQFDPNPSLSCLARHTLHGRRDVTVPGPWKPVETEPRRLAGAHTPQRGGWKLGNDLDLPPARSTPGDRLRESPRRPAVERSRQGAVHRRTDLALGYFTLTPRHRRRDRRLLPFQRQAVAPSAPSRLSFCSF